MSTSRIPVEAGYVSIAKMPRGPRGFPLCRRCATECPTARNTFCSNECVHEWKLRTQPAYQAVHVLERDNGVCALCGVDTIALLAELKRLRSEDRRARREAGMSAPRDEDPNTYSWEKTEGAFGTRVAALSLPRHLVYLTRRLWEMDHVTPVVEGGGSCGLDNLRTLCWACHRRETAALAKRRAAARKAGAR